MKRYAILIIAVILAIAYTATTTLAQETTETLTDSSNTTQKNGKFESKNKKFGERLQAAKSQVIISTLVTTTLPTVTTQTESKVSTTMKPPATTKVESQLITTAEQQSTTEIKQLVSTATELPVTTKVESLLVTTAEQQITTEIEQLVSTATEPPATTTEVTNSTQKEIEIIPIHIHDPSGQHEEGVVECRIPVIKPPDFSAPGRRISKQKCYDYVWNINGRQLKRKLILNCVYTNISRSGTFYEDGIDEFTLRNPPKFPHMGALGWKSTKTNWLFKCASSLISEKFLLTAAQCTTATSEDGSIADPEPKIVRFDAFDLTVPYSESDYEIAKIIVHPKYYYRFPVHHFDIALIELKKDVKFNARIHPACLWSSPDSYDLGVDVLLAGWGDLKISYRFEPRTEVRVSQKLQVGTVELIDSQTCDMLLEPYQNMDWQGLQEHQICAGNLSGGIDSCQGVSGGLLQLPIPLPEDETNEKMKYIFGVTSFNLDDACEFGDTPGIYTKVSSFIDWIEDIVWPH